MQSNLYKKSIQTFTGREFNLLDPSGNVCDIRDIAHALSNIGRYCGHTRVHYSVAQHCVQVSYLVPRHLRLEGLLHDSPEAYIGDVAKPLKELLPDYKTVESRMEEFVLGCFGIDAHAMPPEIKTADVISLVTEQRDLMHGPDPVIMKAYGVQPLAKRIRPLTPRKAEKLFLNRYYEIMADLAVETFLTRCKNIPVLEQMEAARPASFKSLIARMAPTRALTHRSRWNSKSRAPLNASAHELLRRSTSRIAQHA